MLKFHADSGPCVLRLLTAEVIVSFSIDFKGVGILLQNSRSKELLNRDVSSSKEVAVRFHIHACACHWVVALRECNLISSIEASGAAGAPPP